MKPLYQFRFRKEVSGVTKEEMIARFMQRLKESYCDEFEQIADGTIAIRNDLFFSIVRIHSLLWIGIDSARVRVTESAEEGKIVVEYYVSFFWPIMVTLFSFLFFTFLQFPKFSSDDFFDVWVLNLTIITGFGTVGLCILYFVQRSFFHRCLKLPVEYLGKYKWDEIIARKSAEELKLIASGNTHLPEPVIKMAREELLRRDQADPPKINPLNKR